GAEPVSDVKSANVAGPLEFATKTLCPSAVKRRVSVPPMLPAPMIPIFISVSQFKFVSASSFWTFALGGICRHCACERFFDIPKEIIFRPLSMEEIGFAIRRGRFLQFLHFCFTWEIG